MSTVLAFTQWHEAIPNYVYLNTLLDRVKQTYNTEHLLMGWKDAELFVRECNKAPALACGLNDPDALYGKSDYDICATPALANTYREEDRQVLRGKKLTIVDVYQFETGKMLCLTTRVPVIDETYKIVGSAFFAKQLDNNTGLDHLLHKLLQTDNQKVASWILSQENVLAEAGKNASKREQRYMEIRWLLARGFTIKQIAAFYCLSPRTIEDYINEIKDLYRCQNKSEIIERSICEGLLNYLPARLAFNNNILKLINE